MHSLLDQDFYTYSVGYALHNTGYGDNKVIYRFQDRQNRIKYDPIGPILESTISSWGMYSYQDDELDYLNQFFPYHYIDFLHKWRFDPNQVKIYNRDGYLALRVKGPWKETIFWEVPLLATISELYYKHIESKFETKFADEQWKAHVKMFKLNDIHAPFAEFGTRRRRSFDVQDAVLYGLVDKCFKTSLLGTSNVYFAKKYGHTPLGTMSHQWMMGICALTGVERGTNIAKRIWINTYPDNPGFFLTDTYTTPHFLSKLTAGEARLFDGFRQDSGDPLKVMDLICDCYKQLGIEPRRKQILFSDSLTVDKVVEICNYIKSSQKDFMRKKYEIEPVFGIGTHFTNDYPDALNIVIKLSKIKCIKWGWKDCVKLSDTPGKHFGKKQAVQQVKSQLTGVAV